MDRELRMKKVGSTVIKGIIYSIMILLLILCLAPFYLMIINATHSNQEILTNVNFLPGGKLLENFRVATSRIDFGRGFLNSIFVSTLSTLIMAYVGSLTAYGFSKYRFRGKGFLFWVMLVTMMLPDQAFVVGQFKLMGFLNLIDTHWALILPSIVCAGMAFWIKQYCDTTVPNELIESGRIDGAGELQIFHRLIMPLLLPAIACMSIFNFINTWNSFMTPLILLISPEKFTLPLLMTAFTGKLSMDYGAYYCGIAIATVPIMICYLVFSRFIISGLTFGAVKE